MPEGHRSRAKGNRPAGVEDVKSALTVAEKRAKALQLRTKGWSNERIAKALGYKHRKTISKMIAQALRDVPAPDVPEARKVEDAKCDRRESRYERRIAELGKHLVVILKDTDGSEVGRSLDTKVAAAIAQQEALLIKNAERRARLNGYDAPVKTEVTGKDGAPIELMAHDELIARIARLATGGGTGTPDPEPEST